ncbi:hypothetical protein MSAN_01898500 [Mycena sanguinolenta]|uniref:Wax synthase domain-containing protein n=1 Tax=Mycena sanguinolenta TaxID=230812 RepID=A0A8H7CPD0_9AGAR|nr:hypothetical protein MSAN_01898500 [Mycena sanguinolenta]
MAFGLLSNDLALISRHLLLPLLMLSFFEQQVLAQAPVNDVVSWPSGLLLLASVLYAALGNTPRQLWAIEPSVGFFLFRGLPMFSFKTMRMVRWASTACHFVPGIRSAFGISNFWVRAEAITASARAQALQQVTALLSPVIQELREEPPLDARFWNATDAGLIVGALSVPPSPAAENLKKATAKDFLHFAATDYHVFRDWVVEIQSGGKIVFSTRGIPASTAIDVDSEATALYIVAANMVRRPHAQSSLRAAAKKIDDESYVLDLDSINLNAPACAIDMHSYSSPEAKISASLHELAHSYYMVIQHIKARPNSAHLLGSPALARINVGQCLWIAILGGALLDTGRLTIQNLPGKRVSEPNETADYYYLERIGTVMNLLEPAANNSLAMEDTVYSNGVSRRTTIPFLIAGLIGHAIICYFLSVGTSAGVWMSVALANSLYAERLADWHSVWWGKSAHTEQPGFKMCIPGTKTVMCIATLDRSTPRHSHLRQGFLLNTIGLVAAIFGAVFQNQTRRTLGFAPFEPSPIWVSYTSVALCLGTSFLVLLTVGMQQMSEKTWFDHSEAPTRWMIYTTIGPALAVAGLAIYFQVLQIQRFWPVLDALTWISGMPLGMIENGMIFAVDDNLLHLVLLNRWIMGAVASSVGSSIGG